MHVDPTPTAAPARTRSHTGRPGRQVAGLPGHTARYVRTLNGPGMAVEVSGPFGTRTVGLDALSSREHRGCATARAILDAVSGGR